MLRRKNLRPELYMEAGTEFRIQVAAGGELIIMLIEGAAEVFGSQLEFKKIYTFTAGANIAVYTHSGCTLAFSGQADVAYVAIDKQMMIYLNIHTTLEQMRAKALLRDDLKGPTVIVTGPANVGKSSLCKILLNYATTLNNPVTAPLFVDLDVGQNEITIPGSMAAMVVERPACVQTGFSPLNPLVYHYGHKCPKTNVQLYNLMITKLAAAVNTKWPTTEIARKGGMIINTCGWVEDEGYQSLLHAASAFQVDVVIVLHQERLHKELKRDLPGCVQVHLLPKSDGVVERCESASVECPDADVHSYFQILDNSCSPHIFHLKFSDVQIFKIGEAPGCQDSCDPMSSDTSESNRTKLLSLEPSESMVDQVLSVSMAEEGTEEEVLSKPVVAFLYIAAVNMEKKIFTVCSPGSRFRRRNILLLMEYKCLWKAARAGFTYKVDKRRTPQKKYLSKSLGPPQI